MTGGHHSSALPFIDYLREKQPDVEILWFGHKHSLAGNKNPTLEYRQITSLGVPFIDLPAGKFYRTYNPLKLAKLPIGFFVALYHLLRFHPDVIFSFGGYLAVPVVLAGKLLRIPSITHEQTVVVGYANKLVSRFVDTVLISHAESAKYFPQKKVVFSGLPLRPAIFEVRSHAFEFHNDLPVLYITAGKTGSHKINVAVKRDLYDLLQHFNIIHQTGDHSAFQDSVDLGEAYRHIKNKVSGRYYVRPFVLDDEIGEAYAKAHIVMCRAGAHTTQELLALRKRALLVPIPWVSHNEQYLNAKTVADSGLGIILDEDSLEDPLISPLLDVLALPESSHAIVSSDFVQKPLDIMYRELLRLYA